MSGKGDNAERDANQIPCLLGTSSTTGEPVSIFADPTTHRLLVDSGGGSSTNFADNEVVSGSGTTFTLANTPTAGSQHVYASGIRLTPGIGNDYTISGAVLTLANSYSAGQILADYRY